MSSTESSPRFGTDVKPLFRPQDRSAMEFAFDLWSFEDVAANAEAILAAVETGDMPCDGRWPDESAALLRSWIAAGKPA